MTLSLITIKKIETLKKGLTTTNFTPAKGLFLEVFSTLGMKKFPYLKLGPFGNPINFAMIITDDFFLSVTPQSRHSIT